MKSNTTLLLIIQILLVINIITLLLAYDVLHKEINILKQGQTQISGFLMVPGEATGPIKVFYDTGKEEITE